MEDKNSNLICQSLAAKCPTYSRINHQTILIGQQVLIFGGIGQASEPVVSILRFNLESSKIEPALDTVCPAIEGFSLFSYNGAVYLWGGYVQNKPSQSLYCFNGSEFRLRNQNGQVPPHRGFHCSAWIANRYLLIYGGFNQTHSFTDWYLFDASYDIWTKMEANDILSSTTSYQLGWRNGRGFLFSSQTVYSIENTTQVECKNQIFEVRITSYTNRQVRIDPVCCTSGEVPPPRANPIIVFSETSLFLLGGEKLFNKGRSILSDVWIFNFQTLTWTQVAKNSPARFGASPIFYNNKIFLFGGTRSYNQMSTSIDILLFKTKKGLSTQVCRFCRNIYGLQQRSCDRLHSVQNTFTITVKENWDPVASISTNLLSKLSRYMQNPIQAFGLLIDNSLNMSASKLNVSLVVKPSEGIYCRQNPSYILLADNSKPFNLEELNKIMFSFSLKFEKSSSDHAYEEEIKIRSEYGVNFKMAALRLGRSCLIVSKAIDRSIFVGYFSNEAKECPEGESTFNCFCYSLSQSGECSSYNDRQIILQNVCHLVEEKQFIDFAQFSLKIYISDIYDLSQTDNDLVFTPPGIAPSISSLADYISKLYLRPYPGRDIRVQNNRVVFSNLAAKFQLDCHNDQITSIDTSSESNMFKSQALYRVESESYSQPWVYIYHQNRLICTVSSLQKRICGFIEIPDLIEVDFFKSKIESYQDEKKLQRYIQDKEKTRKRSRQIDSFAEYNSIRKMKPAILDL